MSISEAEDLRLGRRSDDADAAVARAKQILEETPIGVKPEKARDITAVLHEAVQLVEKVNTTAAL